MSLEITLLGAPHVRRDRTPVSFDTRKATALLALLALAERPRSRETLCCVLWPDHDPDHARGALRRTLSTLRTGIGEEWIDTTGDSVALRRGRGLHLDVERFRALTADGASMEDLTEAVERHSGAFLEGFALRDSPDFENWQLAEASALKRELASALRRVVAHLVAAGEFERALPRARRWLDVDPLHEPAHRELIRLYAWSGDRAAALEQYRTCVRTLSQELGVAPLEETATLYAEVNDGTLAPPARTEPRRVPLARRRSAAAPPELPLTARAQQLAALSQAHAAAQPDGRLAVIEGEPGIGKTRLATELARRAGSAGAVVLAARCHDDEAGLPYGPIAALLRGVVTGAEDRDWPTTLSPQHLADASLLLPELAELQADVSHPLPLDGPGAQVRLLEGVASVLCAACQGPMPGLVLVDDVHAADEATLDAISYLCRRLTRRPVLLVLTWRSEAVPPGHRLRRLTADLACTGTATIVSPQRLNPDEVAELVATTHGNACTPELQRRVYLESEGLPLFVAEHLAMLQAGGEFIEHTFSPQLRGLLDGRLAGLDDTARQVLGAAAAIGRCFDFETLRHTSGRSDDEAVTALEELVAHGMVREAPGAEPVYDFSHEKLRALVYEQTGLARRRLLHARAATVLAGRRPLDEHAGLVAQHLRLAGDRAGAAEHHRLAAEHAASLYAHADALEHLEAALSLGYPDIATLHERIGDLRTLRGDYGGALSAYETAAAYAEPPQLATIGHKIGNVHHRRGSWERAETCLRDALDTAAEEEHGLRARIQADLALTLHHAGRSHDAKTLVQTALSLAQAAGDRRAEAQAHNMLGVLARAEGERQTAHEHLLRSLELAQELNDASAETAALNNLALLKRDAAEVSAAIELTGRALTVCVRYGDRHREAALENNLADLRHGAGDEEEAMIHLKRAVAIFSEVGADEATRLPEIWKLVSW